MRAQGCPRDTACASARLGWSRPGQPTYEFLAGGRWTWSSNLQGGFVMTFVSFKSVVVLALLQWSATALADPAPATTPPPGAPTTPGQTGAGSGDQPSIAQPAPDAPA